MATATFTKINDWIKNMANGTVDMDADVFRIALSNTAPASEASNPTADNNGILANVTQIAYTNYADDLTVDRQLQGITSTQTAGVYMFDSTVNFTISASGGNLAAFRYIYVYDDTSTAPVDPLVGVWDYGSALTLLSGDSAPITFDVNGMFRIT
jgi:hypothetical protein